MNDSKQARQKGQSVILVAFALVGLVLFVAIAVDISDAYVHRRTAQNAADAAALGGAQELGRQFNADSFSDSAIKAEMNDFAERNNIEDTDGIAGNDVNGNVIGFYLDEDSNRRGQIGMQVDDAVPEEVAGVEALTRIRAPTFFGGILGLDGLPIQAEAAVQFQPVCEKGCVVPIATYDLSGTLDDYLPGRCYNIWNGDGPGNFGWLNWSIQGDSCGEGGTETCNIPCLEENLDPDNCNSGLVSVGDPVAGTTGDKTSGLIRTQLRRYIDNQISFTVPVWKRTNEGQGCGRPDGGLWYEVSGFAEMQLLGYQLAQGAGNAYDPLVDPDTDCVSLGEEPNGGNRLTATFLRYVDGETGNCEAGGTLLAPRLTR
jgi:hypothetical protein